MIKQEQQICPDKKSAASSNRAFQCAVQKDMQQSKIPDIFPNLVCQLQPLCKKKESAQGNDSHDKGTLSKQSPLCL
jgi:hypothetical protein